MHLGLCQMKNVSLFFRVCVRSSHLGLFSSTGSSAAIAKLWTNMTNITNITLVQMIPVLVITLKVMTKWAFWWHLERQMTIMMNVSKAFWQTTQWITFLTLKKGISVSLSAGRMDWILKQNLRRCKRSIYVGLHQLVICHWLKMRWKRWLEAKRRLKSTAAKTENASFRWWRKMETNQPMKIKRRSKTC